VSSHCRVVCGICRHGRQAPLPRRHMRDAASISVDLRSTCPFSGPCLGADDDITLGWYLSE
jgi:hypothetical protein